MSMQDNFGWIMRKRITPLVWSASVLAVMVFFFSHYGQASESSTAKRAPSVITETVDENTGWILVTNKTYGFSLRVPPLSHLESHVERSHERTRVQNFSDEGGCCEGRNLKPNNYWMEIFIYDPKPTPVTWKMFRERFIHKDIQIKNGFKIFSGALRDEFGDTGGWPRGLGVQAPAFEIHIQGSERDENNPILKRIYSTFRFISEMEHHCK
jgi:hypothetical protein